MAKLTKPCPVNAADVEFLVGKDYNNNVVDVPISSLPDFPEVDVECALQNSPTIRDLRAEDAKLLQLYLALKGRLDDFRILPIHLQKSIEELEELNLCNVRITLCDVEGDTTFHGNVNVDETLTAQEIFTDDLTVNGTAMITDEEVAHSHITDLEADDATIERLTVNESIDDKGTLNVEGQTTTKGIDNTGDIVTDSIHADTGEIKTFVSDDTTINTKLEVLGNTITNGIKNTGTIDTDEIQATTWVITDLSADNVTVDQKLEVIGDTVTNGIKNTGTINTDDLQTKTVEVATKLEVTGETVTNGIENTGTINTDNLQTGTAEVATKLEVTWETVTNGITNTGLIETTDELIHNNLVVDGNTDLQTLEVNGAANFREDVKIFDDFYVSGNTLLNGDTKINGDLEVNGDEVHSGNVVYNGDVEIKGTLTAADLDIEMNDYQKRDEKWAPNWYASLDSTGKVPNSQLPNITGGIDFKGFWDPNNGFPTNPRNWDMYQVNARWVIDSEVYNPWDRIIWSSDQNVWQHLIDNIGVQTVNGRSGAVVDVQDTYYRKNSIDLTNPATDKYLSEKAVADLINPLIERIEELEEETAKTTIKSLDSTSWLPATMNEGQSYTVPFENLRATDHIIILDTVTNGNIVITPGNGQISIVSSANETNPVINVLVIKGE